MTEANIKQKDNEGNNKQSLDFKDAYAFKDNDKIIKNNISDNINYMLKFKSLILNPESKKKKENTLELLKSDNNEKKSHIVETSNDIKPKSKKSLYIDSIITRKISNTNNIKNIEHKSKDLIKKNKNITGEKGDEHKTQIFKKDNKITKFKSAKQKNSKRKDKRE